MKSINYSKKRRQTPPWLVKRFKSSFESLYITSKRSKSPNVEYKSASSPSIPEMIYLPPQKQKISSSVNVPKDSLLLKNSNINSSFKISAAKSASNGNLSTNYSQSRTPEKYFSPLNSNWKTVETVAKVKRGRSAINLRTKDSPSSEKPPDFDEVLDYIDNAKSKEKRKFSKKFIKLKLSKLFKSTGKLNHEQTGKNISVKVTLMNGNEQVDSQIEQPNEALRNLSFTAAMMAKDSKQIKKSKQYNEIQNKNLPRPSQTKNDVLIAAKGNEIPSSALSFWKKPSEEKLKASQRRTKDNIFGSNEILLRINTTSDQAKIPSELSLFSEDPNNENSCDFGKICNSDGKSVVAVTGYDKAFQRYQNIISQSQHLSRKDRTLSVAYESDNISQNTNPKMRSCQSFGSVNTLTRSTSVMNSHHDEKSCHIEVPKNLYSQKICSNKRILVSQVYCKPNVLSISPPSYDKTVASNRRSRQKTASLTPVSSYHKNSQGRTQQIDQSNRQVPKPPPRSDSLIRSFELICQNLQNSISEPRGDSFKIFKNQNDYQAWLKNLPYHNPDKISTLLRLRSKVARRQCVSELLNVEISDLNLNRKRRHSWPLLKRTNDLSQTDYSKRSSSLCRVKNKNNIIQDENRANVDSPSLNNYSRLYCLKNSSTNSNGKFSKNLSYQTDPTIKPRPALLNIKPAAFIVQNRRSAKNRQQRQQEILYNSRMSESCHENESNCII